MKTLLIFPPQWTPLNPYFSLASLAAQLKNNNHQVKIRDLNIEFYNHILTKEYLLNSINKAFNTFDYLFVELQKEHDPAKTQADYSIEFQKNLFKYNKIREFKTSRMAEINSIPEEIEESVAVMKDKEKFYSPELLIEALNNIDKALEMASMPYFPAIFEFHNYNNPFFKLTYESIKENCLDKSSNMFYDFYDQQLPSLLAEKPDLIGISINSSFQIVPGLTLAMLLKQKSNTHICIGGNFFGRVTEAILENPELFELFADSFVVDEGEKPIIKLAQYLEGKISISEVPNLVYLDNGVVKATEKVTPLKLNEMYYQDLDDFPLDLYFTPDIVLSIQASRGCYWHQCSFCDHDFGQNYNLKDIDRLIDEIKYLQNKYNISHFEFIDESVSPVYLEEMSRKFIEAGLELNWFNNARLEEAFTKERLELANKAGLRMILWGFESGSKEVMDLINKGIDIDKRLDILKNSRDSGIWNFTFIFFGFPTETEEDALRTIDVICHNTDIISSYGKSIFTLGKHTRLRDDPDKYFITDITQDNQEFSPSYRFSTSKGMTTEQIKSISSVCMRECNKAYDNPLWMYLRYREILFLYIGKYGVDSVQACKIT